MAIGAVSGTAWNLDEVVFVCFDDDNLSLYRSRLSDDPA